MNIDNDQDDGELKRDYQIQFSLLILKIFLTKYHYKGVVSLNDDVQVNGEFITKKRALEGKKDISIYQKYGFKIDIILRNCIINAVKTNDIKTLNALTRNIPMVSLDISKFDQC